MFLMTKNKELKYLKIKKYIDLETIIKFLFDYYSKKINFL